MASKDQYQCFYFQVLKIDVDMSEECHKSEWLINYISVNGMVHRGRPPTSSGGK